MSMQIVGIVASGNTICSTISSIAGPHENLFKLFFRKHFRKYFRHVFGVTASLKSCLVHFRVGRCGYGLRIVSGAVGWLSDGRRTVVCGARVVSGAEKKSI